MQRCNVDSNVTLADKLRKCRTVSLSRKVLLIGGEFPRKVKADNANRVKYKHIYSANQKTGIDDYSFHLI